MHRFPEQIDGPRVRLRRWTPDHAAELSVLVARNVDHLRGRMPWIADEPQPLAARRLLLESWDAGWTSGRELVCAVELDGVAVGSCGLHDRLGPDALEIGYWVDVDHQGRGLVTEAAGAITDAAFGAPWLARVVICHDVTNAASRRVPERLGYRLVDEVPATRPQAPDDTGIEARWELTREAWAARANPRR